MYDVISDLHVSIHLEKIKSVRPRGEGAGGVAPYTPRVSKDLGSYSGGGGLSSPLLGLCFQTAGPT